MRQRRARDLTSSAVCTLRSLRVEWPWKPTLADIGPLATLPSATRRSPEPPSGQRHSVNSRPDRSSPPLSIPGPRRNAALGRNWPIRGWRMSRQGRYEQCRCGDQVSSLKISRDQAGKAQQTPGKSENPTKSPPRAQEVISGRE